MFNDVKHLFDEQGYIEAILKTEASADELLSVCTEHAIEVGAEDVEVMSEDSKLLRVGIYWASWSNGNLIPQNYTFQFICDPTQIDRVKTQLEKLGYSIEHNEHAFFPKSTIKLNPDAMEAYEKLKEKLKAVDGVEDIYDNVEVVY